MPLAPPNIRYILVLTLKEKVFPNQIFLIKQNERELVDIMFLQAASSPLLPRTSNRDHPLGLLTPFRQYLYPSHTPNHLSIFQG